MLRTLGHGHIASALLRDPLAVRHGRAALRAVAAQLVHGLHGLGVVGIAPEHRAADAALRRRAVEAVGVALKRLAVFGDAAPEVEPAADHGRMVGVAQRVVRRTGGGDAHQLHGRRERFLRRAAAGLRVEDHLRVVPFLDPVRLAVVQQDVVLQNADVVEAPRQEDAVPADPRAKALQCLPEGQPLLAQGRVLQAGELGDAGVELFIVFRADEHLKLIGDRAVLEQAHRADLNDLPVDLHREHLFGGVGSGPRLVPLHVQNDVLHMRRLLSFFILGNL